MSFYAVFLLVVPLVFYAGYHWGRLSVEEEKKNQHEEEWRQELLKDWEAGLFPKDDVDHKDVAGWKTLYQPKRPKTHQGARVLETEVEYLSLGR